MMKRIILIISIFFLSINIVYGEEIKFSKCIDGDTFNLIIDGEEKKVRLLAVDTPESVKQDTEVEYYGKEASDYTCKKLKKAKNIEIEYDDNSDKTDKYDRLLLWVFLDGKLLQEELVSGGYAKVAYLYGDYKYTNILKEKQELASSKNIGIWDMDAKKKYEEGSNDTEDNENIEIGIITGLFLLAVLLLKVLKKK